jgi:hypothetical protein
MQLELLFLILRCAGYYSIANVEVDSNTSNGDVALDASGKWVDYEVDLNGVNLEWD